MSDQLIIGFRQDLEQEWIAELECGHGQHIRHDPPWQVHPWILKEEGRSEHIGTPMFCRRCKESMHDD